MHIGERKSEEKRRLRDLATLLIVVGIVFPPALVAGAALGAALAAENMAERWRSGTFITKKAALPPSSQATVVAPDAQQSTPSNAMAAASPGAEAEKSARVAETPPPPPMPNREKIQLFITRPPRLVALGALHGSLGRLLRSGKSGSIHLPDAQFRGVEVYTGPDGTLVASYEVLQHVEHGAGMELRMHRAFETAARMLGHQHGAPRVRVAVTLARRAGFQWDLQSQQYQLDHFARSSTSFVLGMTRVWELR